MLPWYEWMIEDEWSMRLGNDSLDDVEESFLISYGASLLGHNFEVAVRLVLV